MCAVFDSLRTFRKVGRFQSHSRNLVKFDRSAGSLRVVGNAPSLVPVSKANSEGPMGSSRTHRELKAFIAKQP